MKRYELTDHTSDIGIKVYGKSMEELFCNAAFGMFDILADLEGIKTSTSIKIELTKENSEELLVSWLDELIYNFYTKKIIFSEFKIQNLNDTSLKAEAIGRHIGDRKSRLKTEIKAVTYHDLKIEKNNGAYEVGIIFDV